MRKVVLASGSPRRKDILNKIGLNFSVEESGYPEDLGLNLSPTELAEFLSLKKAETVAQNHKDAIIIGADTLVVLDGKIYGKPEDNEDAKKMLGQLSGTTHTLITAFTIIDTESGKTFTQSDKALVTFKKLNSEEIDWYVSTGEPMGKAGAYASQEKGMVFVEKINGNFSTVVGLPAHLITESLKTFGINITEKV